MAEACCIYQILKFLEDRSQVPGTELGPEEAWAHRPPLPQTQEPAPKTRAWQLAAPPPPHAELCVRRRFAGASCLQGLKVLLPGPASTSAARHRVGNYVPPLPEAERICCGRHRDVNEFSRGSQRENTSVVPRKCPGGNADGRAGENKERQIPLAILPRGART